MDIRELRKSLGFTQKETADICKIPLRTYVNYENDPDKVGTIKYKYIIEKLTELALVDENHGILTIDEISKRVSDVLDKYEVSSCVLFGSYARNSANEKSDIDLIVSTDITGLKFFGLVEELRKALSKKVDVLDLRQLINNEELLRDILKEGIRIYG